MPDNLIAMAERTSLFMLAPFLMALNLILARMLSGSVPPLTLSFARWSIAALMLWPFVGRSGLAAVIAQPHRRLFVLALLGGAVTVAPQYVATTLTTPAHVGLIFAATPLLVVLFEKLIWNCSVPARSLVGAAVALTGVAFSALQTHQLSTSHPLLGDGLAFCGALGWAGYTSFLRHRPVELPPLSLLWTVACGGALLLFLPAATEAIIAPSLQITLRIAMLTISISLVASVFVYYFYSRLVALSGPPLASTSMFLVPVYAFAEQWAFQHHRPTTSDVVGLGCILIGMYLLLNKTAIIAPPIISKYEPS
ncbi:DMT family transporter [Novosphingobium rosa]|uniref:DMT family transporter n=1 Tax=Novosphingobium rosa TaxID=76978 RepID=UPI000830E557|nr:DMT family transporter [Novosphingobium rosa]